MSPEHLALLFYTGYNVDTTLLPKLRGHYKPTLQNALYKETTLYKYNIIVPSYGNIWKTQQ